MNVIISTKNIFLTVVIAYLPMTFYNKDILTKEGVCMKKTLIIISSVIILALIAAFIFFSNRVTFNDETTLGNSSGNLLNGGLFCEEDGKIYFSNPNDDGTLYVMNNDCTNFKKLSDDKVSQINAAGKYLFYARKNYEKNTQKSIFNFSNSGIYRINKTGGNLTRLYKDLVGTVNLAGNYIYYQHYSEEEEPLGLSFFRVRIDQKKETCISEEPINPIAIEHNILYYIGTEKNHNIYAMNLQTDDHTLLYEGNAANCIVQDDFIYFMDLENNYAITRISLDGSKKTALIPERSTAYNISPSGKYIYYQVDEGENNGLYRFNTETEKSTLILSGYYNSIHITSNYVFFQEFNTETTYILNTGEDDTLGTFHPPIKQ